MVKKNKETKVIVDNNKNERMRNVEEVITKRKEVLRGIFFSHNLLLFVLALLIILIFTFNVRTSNISQLKDITSGNYTLGPDLDPFLFLRWAKYIVEHGSLMKHDSMRYVPLGYDTSKETILVPYMIAYLYKFLHIFNPRVTVEFAAIIYPVIFFLLATVVFFFFVRQLFVRYSEVERNIIALISTLFFVNMPSLLHRTMAGIPEKEAGGIFFIFLSLYLFLISLNTKKINTAILTGLSAGIFTGILGMVWGGLMFVIFSISLMMATSFFLRNITKKDFFSYLSWIFGFTVILAFLTERYGGLVGLVTGVLPVTFAYGVLVLITVDFLLSTNLYQHRFFSTNLRVKRIPRIFLSLVTTFILLSLFLLFTKPMMIVSFLGNLKSHLLHPIGTDRITLTVAENNQPYFNVWKGTFGLSFFWLFFISSVLIFYTSLKRFKKSEKYILSLAYALFIICIIFSRISPHSLMNGSNIASQMVYFLGFFILTLSFSIIYFISCRKGETNKFRQIPKESILLLVMFFIAIVSARGAIRLFFLLAPVTAILISFISVFISIKALESKEEIIKLIFWITIVFSGIIFYTISLSTKLMLSIFIIATSLRIGIALFKNEEKIDKIILWIIAIFIIVMIIWPSLISFSRATIGEAQGTVPGYYQIQWQKAMAWVRNNTPQDAVFSHWWDYGYWIQTMGERATFLDGGNAIGYWNYQMGRYVLTGKSEKEALEVLKAHNVSYLLIDSTDIGKYPAYSSIGSDLEYDRYNWVPVFQLDERQIRETRNETLLWYQGGTLFSRDFVWYDKKTKQQYLFPAESQDAVIAGVILPTRELSIESFNLTLTKQPIAVIVYKKNRRIDIPMCYLYYRKLYDFKDKGPCLPSALYIIPRIIQESKGIRVNNLGSALFLNQKAIEALWVKLYLFNEAKNFKLVHTEPNVIVEQLNSHGLSLPEFSYFGQILGPIKIWKINYPSNITFREEYLNISYPDPRLTIPR